MGNGHKSLWWRNRHFRRGGQTENKHVTSLFQRLINTGRRAGQRTAGALDLGGPQRRTGSPSSESVTSDQTESHGEPVPARGRQGAARTQTRGGNGVLRSTRDESEGPGQAGDGLALPLILTALAATAGDQAETARGLTCLKSVTECCAVSRLRAGDAKQADR